MWTEIFDKIGEAEVKDNFKNMFNEETFAKFPEVLTKDNIEKTILGLSLGFALVAGSSQMAIAQTQQQGQPQQGQVQTQPQVNAEEIMPQARAQVNSINNEVI